MTEAFSTRFMSRAANNSSFKCGHLDLDAGDIAAGSVKIGFGKFVP